LFPLLAAAAAADFGLIDFRRGKAGTPIAVSITTTGVFYCFVKLLPEPVYVLSLGTNWFI
jgi:hypothetical protein